MEGIVPITIKQTINKLNHYIMNKGTVKFFNESKGFGFIKDANSSKEYFVHSSGLKEDIRENDEVTFDLQEGKKGLNAVNVRLA
jgi:CspA family cold shock protein